MRASCCRATRRCGQTGSSWRSATGCSGRRGRNSFKESCAPWVSWLGLLSFIPRGSSSRCPWTTAHGRSSPRPRSRPRKEPLGCYSCGRLCRRLQPLSLVEVFYFSAYATWRPNSYRRHREYVRALQATGVTIVMPVPPLPGSMEGPRREGDRCEHRAASPARRAPRALRSSASRVR